MYVSHVLNDDNIRFNNEKVDGSQYTLTRRR